jgi:hypothetical protein
MDTIIDAAKGGLEYVMKLPTILLLWPMMNVLGWILKRSPFPNPYIPLVVVPLPAVLMYFMLPYEPGQMSPGLRNPEVEFLIRAICLGLILGFLSWGTHRTLLARLEKLIPGFSTADTETIEKPK